MLECGRDQRQIDQDRAMARAQGRQLPPGWAACACARRRLHIELEPISETQPCGWVFRCTRRGPRQFGELVAGIPEPHPGETLVGFPARRVRLGGGLQLFSGGIHACYCPAGAGCHGPHNRRG